MQYTRWVIAVTVEGECKLYRVRRGGEFASNTYSSSIKYVRGVGGSIDGRYTKWDE
jgi:hypothetical protein